MSRRRFSIVVPTRNRENTLGPTLRTCLAQDFDDYEIIVSDNHSTPATRAVVGELADTRLKYVRSPGPLAMTDSLEFALSHASGEYVIFVGSDDGLVIHALPLIDETLQRTRSRALRWESVLYHWPDTGEPDYAPPNRLLIPLTQTNGRYAIHDRPEGARLPILSITDGTSNTVFSGESTNGIVAILIGLRSAPGQGGDLPRLLPATLQLREGGQTVAILPYIEQDNLRR